VRIATGVVQGLAYASELPVIPVSTLAALAQGACYQHQWHQVISCLDARMDEVYWGAYEYIDGRMQASNLPECVCKPGQSPEVAGNTWYGAGSGWQAYGDALLQHYQGQVRETDGDLYPHARDIAVLASFEAKAGQMLPVEQALPVYLRDQVVHKN
jgi:tRNA threonylcarbamoyladenosine biosynthesis protein TsaB